MTRLAAAHHQSKEDVPRSARCNLAVEVVLPALPWHIDVKRPEQGNKLFVYNEILQSLIDFFYRGHTIVLLGGPQAAPQQPARPPDQWCMKSGQGAVTGMLASCTNNWHRNLNQKFSFCGRVDLAMSSKRNWNYIHAFKFMFKITLHEIEVTRYRRMSVPPSCSNESRSVLYLAISACVRQYTTPTACFIYLRAIYDICCIAS